MTPKCLENWKWRSLENCTVLIWPKNISFLKAFLALFLHNRQQAPMHQFSINNQWGLILLISLQKSGFVAWKEEVTSAAAAGLWRTYGQAEVRQFWKSEKSKEYSNNKSEGRRRFHWVKEKWCPKRRWVFAPIDHLNSLSVTNNSVGSRTATVGNVGAAVVAHVACSGRSRTNAVICNWKGLKS